MSVPICIDDFGSGVYRCRFTGELVWAEFALVVGATVPGVKARHVMANTDSARAAQKASGIFFHESEANCNTCRNLRRSAHPKHPSGILRGKCTIDGRELVFHPDDSMNMPCYVSRWKNPQETLL